MQNTALRRLLRCEILEHIRLERVQEAGDNLLSPLRVPLAQEGLTAVFGMRTGMAPPINHQLLGRVRGSRRSASYGRLHLEFLSGLPLRKFTAHMNTQNWFALHNNATL